MNTNQKKYTRLCPSCSKTMYYKRKKDRNYYTKLEKICKPCADKKQRELNGYSEKEQFTCMTCAKIFYKWRKQLSNPKTPFCSKKCWYNSNLKTLVGQKFGRLLCLERIRDQKKQTTYYKCICDCGAEITTSHANLKSGGSVSCGCKQKEDLIKRSKKESGYAVLTNILNSYRQNAKVANREFLLSREEFEKLILSPCKYCGDTQSITTTGVNGELKHNGIDRVNSSIGYTVENSVACCSTCNYAKSDRSLEDFYSWMKIISKRCGQWGNSFPLSTVIPVLFYTNQYESKKYHKLSRRKPEQSLKNRLIWYYKRNAKNRNIEYLLTEEEFQNLIFSPCFYCGESGSMITSTLYGAAYKHNGIDRLNSSKPYAIDNCVPCCKWCNRAKNSKTLEEFSQWAKRL